jgi:hypothetical protein
MALETRLMVDLTATQRSALDLVPQIAPLAVQKNLVLRNGTGAGNADRMFTDQRTLTASSTEDLDLAGVLTDAFGATLTFARIKLIHIEALATNVNNVVVGGAATNQFINWVGAATHQVVVRPGGSLTLTTGSADATGYAVTATTGDLLRIGNSGAGSSVGYNIVLIGCSA